MIFLFLSWIDFSIPVSNWGKHIMSLLSSKETRVNSISKGFFQTWKGGMWTMGRGKCWRLLVKKRSKSPVRIYWSQWQLSKRFKRQNKEQCHKWSTYIKCCWLHQSDAKVVGNNSIISEKHKKCQFPQCNVSDVISSNDKQSFSNKSTKSSFSQEIGAIWTKHRGSWKHFLEVTILFKMVLKFHCPFNSFFWPGRNFLSTGIVDILSSTTLYRLQSWA